MHDYEKYKFRLINLVRQLHESDWAPTPEAKRLDALVNQLETTVSELSDCRWMFLEEAFNSDLPTETGVDGWPVKQLEDRAGRFGILCCRLRELAALARSEKENLPNARFRPAGKFAAKGLLHVMYECGLPRPSMYDDGDAVIELEKVCKEAGIFLSRPTLRGLLSKAFEEFDPCHVDSRIAEILKLTQ